jgi:hypothetical protein
MFRAPRSLGTTDVEWETMFETYRATVKIVVVIILFFTYLDRSQIVLKWMRHNVCISLTKLK